MSEDAAKKEEERLLRSMSKLGAKKAATPVKRTTQTSTSSLSTSSTPAKQSAPPIKQSKSGPSATETGQVLNDLDDLLNQMSTPNSSNSEQTKPKAEPASPARSDSQNLSSSGGKQKWQEMQKEQERKKQEEEKRKQEYLKKQQEELSKRKTSQNTPSSSSTSTTTSTPSSSAPPKTVTKSPSSTSVSSTSDTTTNTSTAPVPKPTPSPSQPTPKPQTTTNTVHNSSTYSSSTAKHEKQVSELKLLLNSLGNTSSTSTVDFANISDEISALAKEYIRCATASESEFEVEAFTRVVHKIASNSGDVCYSIAADYNRQDLSNQLKRNTSSFLESTIAILTDFNVNSRQKSLTELSSVIKDLQECFNASATKCDKCGEVIDSNYVRVGDKSYHSNCFVCSRCRKPLTGYFEADGDFYCEADYKQYTIETNQAVVCKVCGQIIEGQYIKVDDNPYHSTCFHCSQCGGDITGKFYEKNGSPICENCIKKETEQE